MTKATGSNVPVQVLLANDDDGGGFTVVFESKARKALLVAEGADVCTTNDGAEILISLRSDRRDFEGDYYYLLFAKLVPGKTTWAGSACYIDGVLSEFAFRTEDELSQEIVGCPSGDGIYRPKLPMGEDSDDNREWVGEPLPMMRVSVRVSPRA